MNMKTGDGRAAAAGAAPGAIPALEKWLYGFAGLGQNVIYVVISSFLMFFLTDVYGINPLATGTMMMVGRLWDGINDPIMGVIADRTRTRWGKLRPYILWSLGPVALFTVLNFLGPDFASPTLRLAWCYLAYFGWDIAYTMCDIPYWGLSAAMTSDTKERTSLLTMTRILTMIGMAVGSVGIPLLIGALGGATTPAEAALVPKAQSKAAYTEMAVICAVVGCGLLSLAFFATRERATQPAAGKTSLRGSVAIIAKNKPLLLILAASMLGFGRDMTGMAGMYVTMWIFKSTNYYSLLGGIMLLGTVIAIGLTPAILKRISKRQLYIRAATFGVAVTLALYFLGMAMTKGTMDITNPVQVYACMALLFLESFATGFFTILQTTMIGDSVDYLEWKTGVRAEGLCFSGQTFVTKLSSAACTFVMGAILSATGYVTTATSSQPRGAIIGIFQAATLWPALGFALAIVPMLWYTLDDAAQKRCIDETAERKRDAGAR